MLMYSTNVYGSVPAGFHNGLCHGLSFAISIVLPAEKIKTLPPEYRGKVIAVPLYLEGMCLLSR